MPLPGVHSISLVPAMLVATGPWVRATSSLTSDPSAVAVLETPPSSRDSGLFTPPWKMPRFCLLATRTEQGRVFRALFYRRYPHQTSVAELLFCALALSSG